MKEELRKLGNVGTDGGGVSLEHEGLRQQFRLARLQAMDGTHKLRDARDGVLRAQRGAEWAAEETREEVERVKKVEDHLAETKIEARRWAKRSRAKLAEMRDERVAFRRAANRTLRQLRIANKELTQAQVELTQAEDLAHAGAKVRKVIVAARVVTRLHWKLRKQEKEMQKAGKAYKKQKQDSSWFQRGLSKEVAEAARLVSKQEKELGTARDMERTSRKQLQKAKDDYREAAEQRQNLTIVAAHLQGELSSHPLPTYVPPEVLNQKHDGD